MSIGVLSVSHRIFDYRVPKDSILVKNHLVSDIQKWSKAAIERGIALGTWKSIANRKMFRQSRSITIWNPLKTYSLRPKLIDQIKFISCIYSSCKMLIPKLYVALLHAITSNALFFLLRFYFPVCICL